MQTVTMVCHSEIENEVKSLFLDKLNAKNMELTSQVNSCSVNFYIKLLTIEHHHLNIVNGILIKSK